MERHIVKEGDRIAQLVLERVSLEGGGGFRFERFSAELWLVMKDLYP